VKQNKEQNEGPYEFERPVRETSRFGSVGFAVIGVIVAAGMLSGTAFALNATKTGDHLQQQNGQQQKVQQPGPAVVDPNAPADPNAAAPVDPNAPADPNATAPVDPVNPPVAEPKKPHKKSHDSAGSSITPPVDVITPPPFAGGSGDDGDDDGDDDGGSHDGGDDDGGSED